MILNSGRGAAVGTNEPTVTKIERSGKETIYKEVKKSYRIIKRGAARLRGSNSNPSNLIWIMPS